MNYLKLHAKLDEFHRRKFNFQLKVKINLKPKSS